ncbi:hypothetical protein K7X08_023303 [Anisodus acutangulus]|uniref:RING-type E3 ubiquitin transferase n=1 Tax=Anisodus acutangulus TaxID=402998 RepID=A0A9Q1LI69_9SOLA|nr:hypothetical protein K7X08_023303 [Anisodus acutangulus]
MIEQLKGLFVIRSYIGLSCTKDVPPTQASSSSASAKELWKIDIMDEDRSCDESTCNICLEQVRKGDLVYSLSCLHQFHSRCVDPFLGLNACPI